MATHKGEGKKLGGTRHLELVFMTLEMRTSCEGCGRELRADGDARICTYECTFCPDCATRMSNVCSNCGNELVPRPRRKA
jgi:hypothetical protein